MPYWLVFAALLVCTTVYQFLLSRALKDVHRHRLEAETQAKRVELGRLARVAEREHLLAVVEGFAGSARQARRGADQHLEVHFNYPLDWSRPEAIRLLNALSEIAGAEVRLQPPEALPG